MSLPLSNKLISHWSNFKINPWGTSSNRKWAKNSHRSNSPEPEPGQIIKHSNTGGKHSRPFWNTGVQLVYQTRIKVHLEPSQLCQWLKILWKNDLVPISDKGQWRWGSSWDVLGPCLRKGTIVVQVGRTDRYWDGRLPQGWNSQSLSLTR